MNTSEEDAEDESKHPNILKNKEELDETAKSEEEGVNLNNMTTVTWTCGGKEDVKDENIVEEERVTKMKDE